MTEIVYGSVISQKREPILVHWWHTVDRVSLAFVLGLFGIGVLLGLAASPPLAAKNGYMPLHYVNRQLVFGILAITVMFLFSKNVKKTWSDWFSLEFYSVGFFAYFWN